MTFLLNNVYNIFIQWSDVKLLIVQQDKVKCLTDELFKIHKRCWHWQGLKPEMLAHHPATVMEINEPDDGIKHTMF